MSTPSTHLGPGSSIFMTHGEPIYQEMTPSRRLYQLYMGMVDEVLSASRCHLCTLHNFMPSDEAALTLEELQRFNPESDPPDTESLASLDSAAGRIQKWANPRTEGSHSPLCGKFPPNRDWRGPSNRDPYPCDAWGEPWNPQPPANETHPLNSCWQFWALHGAAHSLSRRLKSFPAKQFTVESLPHALTDLKVELTSVLEQAQGQVQGEKLTLESKLRHLSVDNTPFSTFKRMSCAIDRYLSAAQQHLTDRVGTEPLKDDDNEPGNNEIKVSSAVSQPAPGHATAPSNLHSTTDSA